MLLARLPHDGRRNQALRGLRRLPQRMRALHDGLGLLLGHVRSRQRRRQSLSGRCRVREARRGLREGPRLLRDGWPVEVLARSGTGRPETMPSTGRGSLRRRGHRVLSLERLLRGSVRSRPGRCARLQGDVSSVRRGMHLARGLLRDELRLYVPERRPAMRASRAMTSLHPYQVPCERLVDPSDLKGRAADLQSVADRAAPSPSVDPRRSG
ncbi:MAG: hypothetical protein JWP87_1577 [Labilithrix sp.]|nr:hypothetical protein [Labilithrix sp.]